MVFNHTRTKRYFVQVKRRVICAGEGKGYFVQVKGITLSSVKGKRTLCR